MTTDDLLDLSGLMDCQIIRFTLEQDVLHLYVVGDNEEHSHDQDQDEGKNCEGLNGHLFLLEFSGVKDYVLKGEECDNYKTLKVENRPQHLSIHLQGYNFLGKDEEVSLSFSYSFFVVKDKGEIEGPDA